ncbi:hypothetical protein EDD11_001036, partial [Mortierella claussenii]
SDTCIAAGIRDEPIVYDGAVQLHKVAVSSDSDFLIYPDIPSVLRRVPNKQEYRLFQKTNVLKTLQLVTPAQLAVLGVVSSNDYNSNIPQYGLTKNAAIIRKIPATLSANNALRKYVELMTNKLGEYVSSLKFLNAADIFIRLQPALSSSAPPTNEYYTASLQMFETQKQQRALNSGLAQ